RHAPIAFDDFDGRERERAINRLLAYSVGRRSDESAQIKTYFEIANSTRMKPVLEVKGLRVERGRTTILRRIDWRIERGEHWVVLGANGSGKTSLLKALTGFLSPTAGKFAVLGR